MLHSNMPAAPAKCWIERQIALQQLRIKLLDLRLLHLENKFRQDPPRAPAGSPIGGQWISDGGFVSSGNVWSRLELWRRTESNRAIAFRVAAADIPNLAETVMDWLGPGAVRENSPRGAVQFFSVDRSRMIRFDISPGTSHGLAPHINVEPGRHHIFLK